MDRAVKVAGGLVFQETAEGDIEVLVIDDSFGRVTLPKGHVEPGELVEEAAVREIQEETGIVGKLLAPIAMVSYAFTSREGVTGTKDAYYYLLEAKGGKVKAQLEEVQGARFIPLSTVMDTIMTKGYPNNIDVFVRGTHLIEEWKKKQLVAASKVTLARMSIGTTKQDLTIFCRQTRLYGIASVMVNPLYVKDAVDALKGSETKVCAAIAYDKNNREHSHRFYPHFFLHVALYTHSANRVSASHPRQSERSEPALTDFHADQKSVPSFAHERYQRQKITHSQ